MTDEAQTPQQRINRAVRLIDESPPQLHRLPPADLRDGYQHLLTAVLRELLGDRFGLWLDARAEGDHPWDEGRKPPRPISM